MFVNNMTSCLQYVFVEDGHAVTRVQPTDLEEDSGTIPDSGGDARDVAPQPYYAIRWHAKNLHDRDVYKTRAPFHIPRSPPCNTGAAGEMIGLRSAHSHFLSVLMQYNAV